MRINEGGGLYGFCPAKATWDQEAISLFELMVVSVEQKALLTAGGLSEQPSWFISLLSWFGPAYDTQKFISRAKMVLGDDSPKSAQDAKNSKPTAKGRR